METLTQVLNVTALYMVQVSLADPTRDKFCQFLTATLEALARLLEVTAFADIGKVFSW